MNGEMSASEILQALGLRDRKSLRQRYLLPALQHGHLEMTRPDTPRARNQRYRLTDRGRAARGTGRTT
ncbi:MAG: cell filamentation protein Fic [Gammaproteobacteria bacterium]|nr:cell filamentation protein Fic [Gammaproteobacteria bacterium]